MRGNNNWTECSSNNLGDEIKGGIGVLRRTCNRSREPNTLLVGTKTSLKIKEIEFKEFCGFGNYFYLKDKLYMRFENKFKRVVVKLVNFDPKVILYSGEEITFSSSFGFDIKTVASPVSLRLDIEY